MPSYYTLTSGITAQAQDVNQVINALNGSAGNGIPTSLTAVNDSVNFALAVKNADATNSRALQVLRSNNNVLIQADVNGVIVSPDGGATTAQVMTISHTQTLTNKTLTSPVIGGAGGIPAGTLGFSGTRLLVGDGTFNESVNVGPWQVWTPTLNQGGAVAFTVNVAHYVQIGKTILVELQITANAGGVGANDIIIGGFPVAPFGSNADLAVGTFRFDGATIRIGAVCMVTASTFKFQIDSQAGFLGTAPNVALANGNVLTFQSSFEAL